ncbi:MAG: hypothetical protein GPOALKHO_000194 [Sodalis sp.]|nr:MAG: hypothetical protein GPOALKHO_000194 [Sodalis sp.]
MPQGGVTELVHFFPVEHDNTSRRSAGGGVEDEVIEMPFPQTLPIVSDRRICDGKMIMFDYVIVAGLASRLLDGGRTTVTRKNARRA